MKPLRKYWATLLAVMAFVCSPFSASGQRADIDSLQALVADSPSDTAKALSLARLSFAYYRFSPDSGLLYGRQALSLSQSLGFRRGERVALNSIGANQLVSGEYALALERYEAALAVSQSLGDRNGEADAYNNIGVVYHSQGDYARALEHYQKALSILESLGMDAGVADASLNVGSLLVRQGELDLAVENYRKALSAFEALGNRSGMADAYDNLGSVQIERGDYFQAQAYFANALDIQTELGDPSGKASALGNLGHALSLQGQYDSAATCLSRALEISREMGAKGLEASTLLRMAQTHSAQGRYRAAYEDASRGLSIAREIGDLSLVNSCASSLQAAAAALGRYEEAYRYMRLYHDTHDSLFNREKTTQIATLAARYEFDKELQEKAAERQQAEIELNSRLERRGLMLASALVALALAGGLAFIWARLSRLRQRANSELQLRNRTINEQNAELAQQAEELRQQAEELGAQRDYISDQKEHITDSITYASRIQNAILPDAQRMAAAFPKGHFVFYQPKDIVSGDFYWLTQRKGEVFFAVADCTGHGVPGAFMSMIGNAMLDHLVNEKRLSDPAEILEQLHRQVRAHLHQEDAIVQDGMEIGLIALNEARTRLSFAGAKLSLYVHQGGEMVAVKATRKPIGGFQREDERRFERKELELKPGATAYLFSDGYQDQFGDPNRAGDRQKFSRKRLVKLLAENSALPVETQRDRLEETMSSWQADLPRQDDMLVVGVRLS